MEAGDIVWLTPRSNHGKDVLHRHGQTWTCLRVAMHVACKPGQKSAGLLESPDGDRRWVAELDPDFEATCLPKETKMRTAIDSHEPNPKAYLSTSGGKWRVINQGMPCCADTDEERAVEVLRHFKLEAAAAAPLGGVYLWRGDEGRWDTYQLTPK